MRPLSLTSRMMLSASLVLAIFILLTGLALDRAFIESAQSARQERLLGQLYLLVAGTEVDPDQAINVPETLQEARFYLPGSGLYGYIYRPDGNLVWQSESALGRTLPPKPDLAPGEKRFQLQRLGDGQEILVQSTALTWTVGRQSVPLIFTVAEDTLAYQDQLASYRQSLWGWLGAMSLLLLVAQILVLGWLLRPVRQVASDMRAIENGDKEELSGVYPKELQGLTESLNALIRHERARRIRYQEALADLAHSLKTPLAIMRMAAGSAESREELNATVEEEISRMDHIVQYQLQRAAPKPASRLLRPLPLHPVVEKICASLAKVHRDKAVRYTLALQPGLQLRMEEGDLFELMGNLLDNAFKWARQEVRVTAGRKGDWLILRVEDDGPGIAPEKQEWILERGIRMDQTVPGHGIGLNIVKNILQAYDGRLHLSTCLLGGACFEIRMPGAAG